MEHGKRNNPGGGRNGNVEVLRCLLMFLIVLWHAYVHGNIKDIGPWRHLFPFIVWHVDAFVAISGWYGIRFSWRRLAGY